MFCLDGFRNGGNGGRVLSADVTARGVTISVIRAARPAPALLSIHGGWRLKRLPSQLAGRLGHQIGEVGRTQRRHRVLPSARTFVHVPARVDLPLNVACLPRYTYL